MSIFGNRLRELRVEFGLTQKQLADALGLAFSTISMYERGIREPDFVTMEAIADYFNVSMDYLHGLSNDKNRFIITVTCEECGLSYTTRSQQDFEIHEQYHRKWLAAKNKFKMLVSNNLEELKSHSYDIINSSLSTPGQIYNAWLDIMKSYFSRSVIASGFNLNHVDFCEYVAMLLYQDKFKNRVDKSTYDRLVFEYGTKPGITDGDTLYKIPNNQEETQYVVSSNKSTFNNWNETLLVGEEPSFSLRKADSFDFDSEPFKSLSANKIKELKSLLESACYLTIEQIKMLKQLADNLKK